MVNDPRKSKLAAGLIAILIPGWGIHNFYLGYTGKGIAQLILTITCVGMLVSVPWSIVEGIMILVGSIDRDASGIPLKD
jgi:TM2 domain-containing membrane protein YozV